MAGSQAEDDIGKRAEIADRDPAIDLHGIVEWEPRTALDRVCSWAAERSSVVFTLGYLTAGAVLLGVTVSALLTDRSVAVFTAISVVPALLLVWYIWESNPYEGTPLRLVTGTFLLGGLLVSVPLVVNAAGSERLSSLPLPVVGTGVFFFLVVAPVEEAMKWLAVRLHGYESDDFEGAVDGAVLGAVAGLGFATMENAVHLLGGSFLVAVGLDGAVLGTAGAGGEGVWRAAVAPLHVLWASIAGYHLGLAKVNKVHAGAVVLKGLVIAVALHGLYNTGITYVTGRAASLGDPMGGGVTAVFVLCFYGATSYYLVGRLGGHRRATEIRDETPDLRSEMSMSDEEVDGFMRRKGVGVLSLSDEGRSYSLPMSFGYDADSRDIFLMMAYAPDSEKRRWVSNTERAAFVVHEIDDGGEARSVVAKGRLERASGEDEERGQDAVYGNGDLTVMHESGTFAEETDYEVYRLVPDELTGRRFEYDVYEALDAPYADGEGASV